MSAAKIVARISGLFLLLSGVFGTAVAVFSMLDPVAARWPTMVILSGHRQACSIPF
jgi:hypothetical protein